LRGQQRRPRRRSVRSFIENALQLQSLSENATHAAQKDKIFTFILRTRPP